MRSAGRKAGFGTLVLLPEASEKVTPVRLETIKKKERNRTSSSIRFSFSGARVNTKI